MDWFRHYHGLCTDPKLHKISRSCRCSRAVVIACWVFALESASASGERGKLPDGFDADYVARLLGIYHASQAEAILQAFRDSGMITEDGRIAAWERRQFASRTSTERVRKHRSEQRLSGDSREIVGRLVADAIEIGSDNPLEKHKTCNAETHQNRTEQNRTEKIYTNIGVKTHTTRARKALPDGEFDRWYAAYPRHVGKGQARRAYASAVARASPADLIDGAVRLAAYCARNGTDQRYIPHPATWLNGDRWLDELKDYDRARSDYQYISPRAELVTQWMRGIPGGTDIGDAAEQGRNEGISQGIVVPIRRCP